MVQNCIKHLKDERTLTVKNSIVYAIFMTHERILRVQNSMKHLQQIKEYLWSKTLGNIYDRSKNTYGLKLYETFMTTERILMV